MELAIDVKRMALEDGGKTVGSVELSQRMEELRLTLAEHTDLIFSHHGSPHIHAALLSLRTVLLSCHLILRKALAVSWRRSARFKQPVRISINDVVVGLAKLGNAISPRSRHRLLLLRLRLPLRLPLCPDAAGRAGGVAAGRQALLRPRAASGPT